MTAVALTVLLFAVYHAGAPRVAVGAIQSCTAQHWRGARLASLERRQEVAHLNEVGRRAT